MINTYSAIQKLSWNFEVYRAFSVISFSKKILYSVLFIYEMEVFHAIDKYFFWVNGYKILARQAQK